jgi:hypothetical protein
MKYPKAKETLQHALDNQSTITISKLKKLMGDLNITLESSESKEVEYLKKRISKLSRRLGRGLGNKRKRDEENERLREALRFYADKENHDYNVTHWSEEIEESNVMIDKGEKARKVLEGE